MTWMLDVMTRIVVFWMMVDDDVGGFDATAADDDDYYCRLVNLEYFHRILQKMDLHLIFK